MANIGYAYVGELADFKNTSVENTPDGMRYCRPILVRELLRRRHNVFSLQYSQEKKLFPSVNYSYSPKFSTIKSFPRLDVLFIEWRWKTYKGDTPDLSVQHDLLNMYHGKIPIIIYDASYKLTGEDEQEWPRAIIADPGINPRHISRERERLLFWSDYNKFPNLPDHEDGDAFYGYVGNDYERRESFDNYYAFPASILRLKGIQTAVYGNWLKKSAERDPVKEFFLKEFYDKVYFGGRWSFFDSMRFQSKFLATTHIAKDLYYKHGNITVRFFDSMATDTIGLVPGEYFHSNMLGKDWIVTTPLDVVEKLKKISKMTVSQRREVVEQQRRKLQSEFPQTHVNYVADFIESYA